MLKILLLFFAMLIGLANAFDFVYVHNKLIHHNDLSKYVLVGNDVIEVSKLDDYYYVLNTLLHKSQIDRFVIYGNALVYKPQLDVYDEEFSYIIKQYAIPAIVEAKPAKFYAKLIDT
jgi:hypothetical protein